MKPTGEWQGVISQATASTNRSSPISRKEPFDNPDWLFDFKYDGFRARLYLEEGSCRLISRNGNALSRFAALCHQVAAELAVDDVIMDGEVIAADETGRPLFYDHVRGAHLSASSTSKNLWEAIISIP